MNITGKDGVQVAQEQKKNTVIKKLTQRWFSKEKKNNIQADSADEEFERCILCGRLTCIPISMPVDWRENYEPGLGQICAECARKQKGMEITESILSDEEILFAVEQSREET